MVLLAKDAMFPINGPMIREETTQSQAEQNDLRLQVGNQNVATVSGCRAIEGESGRVQTESVESWMKRLMELHKRYKIKPEDIWMKTRQGVSPVR